jgi:hypothetical protein
VTAVGRNEPCPCGSGAKYKRCCLDLDNARRLATAAATKEDQPRRGGGEVTFLVETPAGVLVRRIPNAAPVANGDERGVAVEEAVHGAAATWGLPDFTFRGATVEVGRGSREIGDNLLIVGDVGVVVQVKSRAEMSDADERERAWVTKQVAHARSQARGSVRRLKMHRAPLTNARGRLIDVDGSELRWLAVVIIDHPQPPNDYVPPASDATQRGVVMLRRDWDFLFDQLKSTHAVIEYLERVADEPVTLGEEPARYFRLALADHQTEPDEVHTALARHATHTVAAPQLPLHSAGGDRAQLLVRAIFEDVATAPLDHGLTEHHRLAILGELDRLPVNHRAGIGEFLIEGLQAITDVRPGEGFWRHRRFLGAEATTQLAFGVCSSPLTEMERDFFSWWVQLRHHDWRELRTKELELPDDELTTVGVLLTPRPDGRRPFDTTVLLIRGEVGFDDEQLALLREHWPIDKED